MKYLNSIGSCCMRTFCLLFMLVQGFVVHAQVPINGTVLDQQNKPIAGVTVKVKQSTQTSLSDEKGEFKLQVDKYPVQLDFSYVGYESMTLRVTDGRAFIIQLNQGGSEIDEVVVVAYGAQKKSTMVGSVAQIKGEEIKKAPAMNLTNALAGRMPGLTVLQQSGRPGADNAELYVRGIGTYGSNRGPLIIVDDIERPASTLANLDPNEVESISVLKDAVAVAAYGAMAGNGIIVVKTKAGNRGRPKISYDFGYNIGQNTRFPKFLDGPDYMTWYNKGTEVDNDYLLHTNQPLVPYIYAQDLIDAVRDGSNTNPLFGNTDWVGKLAGNNSKSQHHSATISGGSENTQYFAAINHLDQDGIIDNTNFKRYNLRTNISTKVNEYISFGLNIGLRHELSSTPGISPDNTAYMNPFYQAVRMLPNLPMYAPNGLPTAYQAGAGWVNPLASVEKSGYQHGKNNVFQGQAHVQLSIPQVEGLSAKLNLGYDNAGMESKIWLSPYNLMGRTREQVVGDYTPLSTVPGITKTSLSQGYAATARKTLQGSLNYTRTFANNHNVGVLALYEYSRGTGNKFGAGASNFPLEIIQDINYGSKDPADVIASTGSTSADESRAGVVTRFNYSFKEKYLVEMVARWDASVNFAKENRWKPSPAAGLGWVISKEDFFSDHVSFVDYLKLKTSIGVAGNDKANLGSFPYMRTFSQTDGSKEREGNRVVIDGIPVFPIYVNALENPKLKWETSTMYNIGFESRFLNGKFGFDFEWFYKHTKDILGQVSSLYPASLGGYFPAIANIGEVDNRGFDAQIRYNETFGSFKLGLTGNVNWAKNRYLKLDEAAGTPSYQSLIGRSIGTKLGFVAEGMVQTWEEGMNTASPSGNWTPPGFFKYRDINGDGKITRTEDMTYIGRSNVPEIMYGLNIDMAYKGFDFSALFQGAGLVNVSLAGTYEGASGVNGVDDNTPFTRAFYNYGNSPYFLVENSWTPDNINAEFPRLSAYKATGYSAHNAHKNSGWVRRGDYLRLKSIQLGYTLPKQFTQGAKIENVRLSITGSNLFTWDYLKYLDPEMPNVNNGFYPQQKIYAFGVSVTF